MKHRLGVLAVYFQNKRLEELSFYRNLSLLGSKLGIQVEVFTPEDLQTKDKVNVRVYDIKTMSWTRKHTSVPPLIYDRCRYHGVSTYRLLKSFRQKYRHLTYISKPLANKWRMHTLLTKQESLSPYIPATEIYENIPQLIQFLKKHKIIFAKPKNGTGGRGIIRMQQLTPRTYQIEGRNQDRTILPLIRIPETRLKDKLQTLGLNRDYIIQKGISSTLDNGRVHDFRLLIQKNGEGQWVITGCAGRIGPKKSITSNLHGGGMAIRMDTLLLARFASKEKIVHIKRQLQQFSLELAHYLENEFGMLCELGIDIAIDPRGKIWLLEVNPKPSRDVFRRIGSKYTYQNAIKRPLEYAKWLLSEERLAHVKMNSAMEKYKENDFV